ncbi:hypothetical protein MASR1M66_21030 [Aminivibrio sp.]
MTNTTYYWRVRAIYGSSPEWSDWSETWSFTTEKNPNPPAPGGGGSGCQATSAAGALGLLLPLALVLLRRGN